MTTNTTQQSYNLYNSAIRIITENINRYWTSSLFLGLNLKYFVSSSTGSMIFKDKCTTCITRCSTYVGVGFFVFLDSVDLRSNKCLFASHDKLLIAIVQLAKYMILSRKELTIFVCVWLHMESHFPFVASDPALYAWHSTQSFSSSHRCPGQV